MQKFVLKPEHVDEALDTIKYNAQKFSEYLESFINALKSFIDLATGFIVKIQKINDADEFRRFLNLLFESGLFKTSNNKKIVPFWSVFLSSYDDNSQNLRLLVDVFVKKKDYEIIKKFGIEAVEVSDKLEDRFYNEIGGQQIEQEKSTTNAKVQLVSKLIKKLDDISYMYWNSIFKYVTTYASDSSIENENKILKEIMSDTGTQQLVSLDKQKTEYFYYLLDSFENSIFDYALVLNYLLKKYVKFFNSSFKVLKKVLATEYFLYITLANTSFVSVLNAYYDIDDMGKIRYWFAFRPYGDFKNTKTFISLLSNDRLNPKSLTNIVNVLYWFTPNNVDILRDGRVSIILDVYDFDNLPNLNYYQKWNINFNFLVMTLFFSFLIYGDVDTIKKFYVFVSFFELSLMLTFICEFELAVKMRLFETKESVNFIIIDDNDENLMPYLEDDSDGELETDLGFLKTLFKGDDIIKNLFVRLSIKTFSYFKQVMKKQYKNKKYAFFELIKNKSRISYTYTGFFNFLLSCVREFTKRVVAVLGDPIFVSAGVRNLDDEVLDAISVNQENLSKNMLGLLMSGTLSKRSIDTFKLMIILPTDVALNSFLSFLNFSIPYTESDVDFVFLRDELRGAFVGALNNLWKALGKIGGVRRSFL